MPPVTRSLGDGTQSVLLTVAILESVADTKGSVSISELAREIGTSKSRIFRHLQTLISCGFIANDGPDGEYRAGSRLMQFCRTVNERYDLVGLADPIMSELRERFGHTVIISRVDTTGVHVLKSLSGNSAIVVGVRAGAVLPFAISAQGKAALAFMPAARRGTKTALAVAYKLFEAEHADELQNIRKEGFASGQMREGLFGLAAPVFDHNNDLIATIALLDTTTELSTLASTKLKGRALVEAARRLGGGTAQIRENDEGSSGV